MDFVKLLREDGIPYLALAVIVLHLWVHFGDNKDAVRVESMRAERLARIESTVQKLIERTSVSEETLQFRADYLRNVDRRFAEDRARLRIIEGRLFDLMRLVNNARPPSERR